jgi:hypothetical protein
MTDLNFKTIAKLLDTEQMAAPALLSEVLIDLTREGEKGGEKWEGAGGG